MQHTCPRHAVWDPHISAVARIWHIQDSQGQVMAMAQIRAERRRHCTLVFAVPPGSGRFTCAGFKPLSLSGLNCCLTNSGPTGTRPRSLSSSVSTHPGGNPGANLESISHSCYLREVEFEWDLNKETIYFPLGFLQGGLGQTATASLLSFAVHLRLAFGFERESVC